MFPYLGNGGGIDEEAGGQVLNKDIPWETYMTARLISEKDLQLIRRYDKRSDELRASMLDEVKTHNQWLHFVLLPPPPLAATPCFVLIITIIIVIITHPSTHPPIHPPIHNWRLVRPCVHSWRSGHHAVPTLQLARCTQ